ncbi:hypothetical protein I4U23_018633 [Adineta vaga]|nr:hypothetical protein I4U23_018633 [Adineta vaga]
MLQHRIHGYACGSCEGFGDQDGFVAETYYFINHTERKEYEQVFVSEALFNVCLDRLSFWTTPNAGGDGGGVKDINIAYPFAIDR